MGRMGGVGGDGRRRGCARMKWCAGGARGIGCVGRWTEAGAPWVTWVQSAMPNVCNQPTPAVARMRGVEDAAPYGREENHSISITANKRVNAANLCPRPRLP